MTPSLLARRQSAYQVHRGENENYREDLPRMYLVHRPKEVYIVFWTFKKALVIADMGNT